MFGGKIRKQNMNTLCFSPHGIMLKEVERIFYSQFREPRTYLKIINLLKNGTHILPEMQRKCALLKVPRGYALERALISLYGPDNSLKDAGYFHHFVT
jgi:hypothetical protein